MSQPWKGKHSQVANYIHDRIRSDVVGKKKIFSFVNSSLKGNFGLEPVERLRVAIFERNGISVATTEEDIPVDCLDIGLGAEWGRNMESVVAWWTDKLIEVMLLKTYHLLDLPFDEMKSINVFWSRLLDDRKRRSLRC